MLGSSILGFIRPSRSMTAALCAGALVLAGSGCEKDSSAANGDGPAAVKEEPASAPGKGTKAEAAQANQEAAPSDVGAGNDTGAAKPEASVEQTGVGAAAVKADPGKPTAGARQAGTETAAPTPTEAAPQAEPSPAAPAPPAIAAETAPTVTSPKVGETNFSVWMQSSGKHKAGQQGTVEVVLAPQNGFHCNENYPYKIKLNDAPAGVSYPQPIVRRESMSVSPDRGVMRVPFVASATGDTKIAGKFSFSVCSSDQCLIDSRDLAITVKVE